MTATQLVVDVYDREVTTALLVTTVRTSSLHHRGTGEQRSVTTHCTATEVTETWIIQIFTVLCYI